MDLKKICRGCFQEKPEAGGTCPYCGFDEIKYERKRDPEVLPLNTVLQGKYVIGRCLGRGGFGITYLGWHMNLETVVAIKEFFPSGIVSRDTANPDRATRSDVTMVNTGSTKAYRKSLDGFIKEAKTLGALRLPGVVLVHDFFEENRTAYIVMDYVEGENLTLWLKHSGGKLPEAQVLKLIRPLTGSLQKLHEKGIIHRDISPDNLILQPDGSIMLVDFGAARTVVLEQEAEKAVQSMTVVLKPGYAPIEQYSSHGHQGPWTDVYAFCATVFRMLTGSAPADPSTRAVRENDEEMLRTSLESAGVSQKTINALMKGMQLLPQDRCQSMRELDKTLYGTTGDEGFSQPSDPSGRKTNKGLITAVLIGAFILSATVIGFTLHFRNSKIQEPTERAPEVKSQEAPEKMAVTEQHEDSEQATKTEFQKETEVEYDEPVIMYANADINVRETPTVDTQDNIISSYDRGDKVTVIGETDQFYKIYKKYDNVSKVEGLIGYVMKQFISDTDTARIKKTEKVNVEIDNYEIGDIITFGTYEQDNNTSNGSEPIEWLVLEKEDEEMLVISKYGLDAKAYNKDFVAITWEKCSLRGWLNDEFYQTAFSDEEQGMIATSYVKADDNDYAGNDTEDKVFLLSIAEAESLFQDNESRICTPTEYVVNQGTYLNKTKVGKERCLWWLRSIGNHNRADIGERAANVSRDGAVYSKGNYVYNENICVRPALWIKLTS